MKTVIQHQAIRAGVSVAVLMAAAMPAAAIDLELGQGWTARLDSELSTGFQVRTQGRNCELVAIDNGGCAALTSQLSNLGQAGAVPDFNYLQMDSGNVNFDAGDLVSWAVKGTHDLSVKGPDEWSGLLRFNWSSDFGADWGSNFGLPDDSESATKFDITLLDFWVAKGFTWGDSRNAKIRLGNQVVSWGEDIFIPGGINVINAVDLRKFHTPGTALKEVFVPAPMVYVNTGLTDNLSAEAYYQFMWNDFEFDPVGTFFSTVDVLGPGAQNAYIPSVFGGVGDEHVVGSIAVPHVKDNKPSDQGQLGMTFRYQLGDAEVAAHYVRYHDKIPFISFTGDATGLANGFFLDYGEDRNLFGLSGNMPVATSFGDIVFGAEVSFRPADSVAIDPTIGTVGAPYMLTPDGTARGFVEEEKWQAHLTANYLFSPDSPLGTFQQSVGGTDGYILAEAAFVGYPGLQRDGTVPYLLTDYSLPDKFSWGYVIEVGLTFPHIFGTPVNLTPYVDFTHDVMGTSPNASPFIEERKSLAFNMLFNYIGKMKTNLTYARYWDGGTNNLMRDRDFVGMSFTYSF